MTPCFWTAMDNRYPFAPISCRTPTVASPGSASVAGYTGTWTKRRTRQTPNVQSRPVLMVEPAQSGSAHLASPLAGTLSTSPQTGLQTVTQCSGSRYTDSEQMPGLVDHAGSAQQCGRFGR